MIQLYKLPESFLLVLIIVTFAFGQPNTVDPRTGHISEVKTASFSPDNKMLGSASEDGLIIVWDLTTNKEIFKINPSPTEKYKYPVFSSDGRIVAGLSCSESGYSKISGCKKVEFWDSKSGKSIGSLKGEFSEVQEISFSPDKKTIAVADNNNISLWDITTKEELQTLDGAVAPMVFNPSGTILAASNGEDGVDLWNVKIGSKVRTIDGVSNALSLVFNPLGDVLASVNEFTKKDSDDTTKYVRLWRVATGAKVPTFADVKTGGLCAFTADGKNLMVSAESEYYEIRFSYIQPIESILLLNPTTGRKQSGLTIDDLNLSGDIGGLSSNRQLLAVMEGRNIHVIDLQKKDESNALKGHSINVKSMAYSPDGKNLLSGYEDGTIVRWDAKTGKVISLIEAGKNSYDGEPVLIPNSDYFIRGSSLVFFNLTDGMPFKNDKLPLFPSKGFAFSRDGKTVVMVSDETISFFELPSMRLINRFVHQLPTKDTYEVGIAFAPDGKTIAIAIKTDITLWDVSTGKIVKSIPSVAGGIGNLAFSPDNKFLVAAPSAYSTNSEVGIQVFDLATNKLIYKLLPKQESFPSIPSLQKPYFAISPESKMLATIDKDGKVNFFNLADGKLLLTSKNAYDLSYERAVLAFNPDGSILAVGERKGIKLFRTDTGGEIQTMK